MGGDATSLVREKIRQVRTKRSAYPVLDQISLGFEREAETRVRRCLGCLVEAMVVDFDIHRLSDVLDELPMPTMIGIVQNRHGEPVALFNLEMELVGHLIDILMGGDPNAPQEIEARAPGKVDEALSTYVIGLLLEGFNDVIARFCEGADLGPLDCVAFESQPMSVNVLPGSAEALRFRVSLDIGEAARNGNFDLIVALAALDPIKPHMRRSLGASAAGASELWLEHMRGVLRHTPLEMTAELDRQSHTLEALAELRVGDLLELPERALEAIAVTVALPRGPLAVARGELGAWRSRKALRIGTPPDAAMVRRLETLLETGRST